ARDSVRRGRTSVAVIVPRGFGDAAGRAFFSGRDKPQLEVLFDPSHATEVAMVRGILTEHVMQAVSKEMFGGPRGRQLVDDTLRDLDGSTMPPDTKAQLRALLGTVQSFYNATTPSASNQPTIGFTMPYTVREEAMTAGANIAYNGYAHSFAGMG